MTDNKAIVMEAPLPLRTLALYSLPVAGSTAMFWLVNIYLLKFATSTLLVSPALIGALFGLARLSDALTDPLTGYFSDRGTHRLGRRRPWILSSALPVGLSFYVLWSVPAGLGVLGVATWVGLGLIGFYAAHTAFNVPHAALGAELSLDHHERTRVFGVRACFEVLGIGLAIVCLYLLETSEAPRATATQLAVVLGVITALGIATMGVGVKERAEFRGRGPARPYAAFRDVLRNPHARRLLAVFFLSELAFGCLMVTLPFASEHILGAENGTAGLLARFLVPMAIAVPLWIPVSRQLGKSRSWLLGQAVAAAAIACVYFVTPENDWTISVLAALIGMAIASSRTLPASIQADIIDFDEMQTGERKEGAYLAAWNLAGKAGGGISVVVAGVVLQIVGIGPGAAGTPAEIEAGLRLALAVIPAAFLTLSTLLLAGFQLDERAHGRVRDALQRRNRSPLVGASPIHADS